MVSFPVKVERLANVGISSKVGMIVSGVMHGVDQGILELPRTSYNLRSRRGAGALEQDDVTEVSLNWLGSRSEDAPEEAN